MCVLFVCVCVCVCVCEREREGERERQRERSFIHPLVKSGSEWVEFLSGIDGSTQMPHGPD